eukprot:TRINITY_DN18654_c0_g1_i3.p1 TRINITY_DN18654_c0_g1~~TRINITY_DN18654_c0_g1_i3.p1  ORF type:complete len:193 (+),score=20.21 TRINITY_DN18654_c0_g1_i3:390-968(+)
MLQGLLRHTAAAPQLISYFIVLQQQPSVIRSVPYYVVMNLVDLIRDMQKPKMDWTSNAHHIASGFGFTLDAVFGSEHTAGMAAISLLAEAVAPFYQAYYWLHNRRKETALVTQASLHGVIWCTVLVRWPLNMFILYVVSRDIWRKLRKKSKREVLDEVQVQLLLPASMGCLFMWYLDYIWIRQWAVRKLSST